MSQTDRDYVEFEVDFSEKEPSFEEKIVSCEVELDKVIKDHRLGVAPENENVGDEFFTKRRSKLEKEYLSLVCEASEQDYSWWLNETVDKLMFGILNNESRDESERLMEIFELYRRAKKTRNPEQ